MFYSETHPAGFYSIIHYQADEAAEQVCQIFFCGCLMSNGKLNLVMKSKERSLSLTSVPLIPGLICSEQDQRSLGKVCKVCYLQILLSSCGNPLWSSWLHACSHAAPEPTKTTTSFYGYSCMSCHGYVHLYRSIVSS